MFSFKRQIRGCRGSSQRNAHCSLTSAIPTSSNSSDIPVLVMEYLPYCLDSLLEDKADMSLAMKCSVLCDVVQALAHLHAHDPSIVHRNITASNVLLTLATTGKVTDLGVSRMTMNQKEVVTTRAQAYMPPEVDTEENSTSIDMFSFGHLALYTIVQDFPYPSPAVVMDTNNPGVLVARSEVQRRSRQMEQLKQQLGDETHTLVQLVTQCLHNNPRQRPLVREVLTQLEKIKAQIEDPYECMSKLELIQALRKREGGMDLGAVEVQVKDLQGQLQIKDVELEACQVEIRTKEAEASSNLKQVQDKLRSKEQDYQDLLKELKSREQEVQELRAQLERREVGTTRQARTTPQSPVPAYKPSWLFTWRRGGNMNYATRASTGSGVVALDGKVYFDVDNCGSICVYTIENNHWSRLPVPSPLVYYYRMAAINQQLVVVGVTPNQSTVRICMWDSDSRMWTNLPYGCLPAARSPVVFGHQQFLVVAGGFAQKSTQLRTVQVYNASTRQWFSTSNLPMDCSKLTPAMVNDTLYLINDTSENILSISLSALVAQATSSPPAPPPSWEAVELDSLSLSTMAHICPPALPSTWPGASAELSSTTFVCLHGRLLAVGGKDENGRPSSAIFLYNPKTGQKTKIGDLPALLYECLCVVLPSGELMVLGGYSEDGRVSQDVFIATVE